VGNQITGCAFAAEVAFVANSNRPLKVNEPYPVICRNQIANVRAVRYDQQFRVAVGLPLEAQDRLRKPLSPILRQTNAFDESSPARSPGELRREKSLSFRSAPRAARSF